MWKRRGLGNIPAIRDGDDAGAVLGDLEEHGHGEIEVRSGRVAPTAIVAGESIVWRAKIGGGYEDGRASRVAPVRVVDALELKACSTREAIVE